jgi:hypothetical protein
MSMHICEHTGLLYINDVPFTLDHLKAIRKLFKYSKKTANHQFIHEVVVTDTANQFNIPKIRVSVSIDEALIDDIFKLYDVKKFARDKDFEM